MVYQTKAGCEEQGQVGSPWRCRGTSREGAWVRQLSLPQELGTVWILFPLLGKQVADGDQYGGRRLATKRPAAIIFYHQQSFSGSQKTGDSLARGDYHIGTESGDFASDRTKKSVDKRTGFRTLPMCDACCGVPRSTFFTSFAQCGPYARSSGDLMSPARPTYAVGKHFRSPRDGAIGFVENCT